MKRIFTALLLGAVLGGCHAQRPLAAPASPAPLLADSEPALHEWSGMTFPATVGNLVRADLNRFDESGRDISVGYRLRDKDRALFASVYIYPTPGAGDGDGRGPAPDALGQTMLCAQELEVRKRELLRFHPDSVLTEGPPVVLEQNGVARDGRHVTFNSYEEFGHLPQNVSSELYLFCFAKDNWTIAYRFTYPSKTDVAGTIAAFMRTLQWPD